MTTIITAMIAAGRGFMPPMMMMPRHDHDHRDHDRHVHVGTAEVVVVDHGDVGVVVSGAVFEVVLRLG